MNPKLSIRRNHFVEREIEIYLPDNWWNKNYPYRFVPEYKNSGTNIFPIFNDEKIVHVENMKELFKKFEWQYSDGDYLIRSANNGKDFLHYQKKKKLFFKYSIYPAIIFALVFTFSILSIIADFTL